MAPPPPSPHPPTPPPPPHPHPPTHPPPPPPNPTHPPPAAAGGLEFLFVLEDKADPAHAVIAALIQEVAAQRGGPALAARLHSAGAAERTSQKIHK